MLSINCKDAGDPDCSHTITGATGQELFYNAKKHAIETHGMTTEQRTPKRMRTNIAN